MRSPSPCFVRYCRRRIPHVITRLIAGLAEGILIANMAALIAMTAQPDRLFGLYMACNLGASTILLAILGVLVASARDSWAPVSPCSLRVAASMRGIKLSILLRRDSFIGRGPPQPQHGYQRGTRYSRRPV
jgi:MFS family permease